jgi:ribosomal protein L6P/L9E
MNLNINTFSINIPVSFNILIVENKKNKNDLTIILYNKMYTIYMLNKNKNIKIDLETYCIKIKTKHNHENNINFKQINKFLKTFEFYFFLKIKFKGKGFKIKFNKKLKIIKFYFGRSHITFFKLKKIKLKKVTKYKFVLKSLNFNKLKKKSTEITWIKPVNVYTLRGIRISKQLISKRKGKKSSYI